MILEPEPLDELLPKAPTPEPRPVLPMPETPPTGHPSEPKPQEARPPAPPHAPAPAPTPIPAPAHVGEPAPVAAPVPVPAATSTPPSSAPPAPATWEAVPEPPHLPHFSPVPLPAPAADSPPPSVPSGTAPEEGWIRIGTTRRGNSELVGLGWAVVLIGLALLAGTYYWAVAYGDLFAPAGVRGDYIAAVLILIGFILGTVFVFLPTTRKVGLGTDASSQQIENLVRYTNGQVLLSQLLAGVGLALVMLGFVWMAYWLRLSFVDDFEPRSSLAGLETATYVIGAPLIILGFFILLFFLGRISTARRTRNAAVLLLVQKRSGASLGNAAVGGGVTEQEIQDLMKRIDALMAQLPDAAVTEFSKTKEADTYLKLLGS